MGNQIKHSRQNLPLFREVDQTGRPVVWDEARLVLLESGDLKIALEAVRADTVEPRLVPAEPNWLLASAQSGDCELEIDHLIEALAPGGILDLLTDRVIAGRSVEDGYAVLDDAAAIAFLRIGQIIEDADFVIRSAAPAWDPAAWAAAIRAEIRPYWSDADCQIWAAVTEIEALVNGYGVAGDFAELARETRDDLRRLAA